MGTECGAVSYSGLYFFEQVLEVEYLTKAGAKMTADG
jgi:hypothetical protein